MPNNSVSKIFITLSSKPSDVTLTHKKEFVDVINVKGPDMGVDFGLSGGLGLIIWALKLENLLWVWLGEFLPGENSTYCCCLWRWRKKPQAKKCGWPPQAGNRLQVPAYKEISTKVLQMQGTEFRWQWLNEEANPPAQTSGRGTATLIIWFLTQWDLFWTSDLHNFKVITS